MHARRPGGRLVRPATTTLERLPFLREPEKPEPTGASPAPTKTPEAPRPPARASRFLRRPGEEVDVLRCASMRFVVAGAGGVAREVTRRYSDGRRTRARARIRRRRLLGRARGGDASAAPNRIFFFVAPFFSRRRKKKCLSDDDDDTQRVRRVPRRVSRRRGRREPGRGVRVRGLSGNPPRLGPTRRSPSSSATPRRHRRREEGPVFVKGARRRFSGGGENGFSSPSFGANGGDDGRTPRRDAPDRCAICAVNIWSRVAPWSLVDVRGSRCTVYHPRHKAFGCGERTTVPA